MDSKLHVTVDPLEHVRDLVMTVHVKHRRTFNLRIWLAIKLIALASFVLGCQHKIEYD